MLVLAELDVFAHDLRLDGQFAPAALDETGEHHGSRPAVVEDFIERGADGASGVQHVIHQDQMPILDVHRQVRGADLRVHADTREVVAVERDVERAERFLEFQQPMQALGDPYATGVDADHKRIALEHRAQLLDHARHGGVDVDRHRHGESPGSSLRKACRMVWAATLSRRDL